MGHKVQVYLRYDRKQGKCNGEASPFNVFSNPRSNTPCILHALKHNNTCECSENPCYSNNDYRPFQYIYFFVIPCQILAL